MSDAESHIPVLPLIDACLTNSCSCPGNVFQYELATHFFLTSILNHLYYKLNQLLIILSTMNTEKSCLLFKTLKESTHTLERVNPCQEEEL